jgi:mRNA interferase HigB
MHVISRKRLNEFAEHHSEAKASLAHWYRFMKRNDFSNFVELRAAFPSADQVGKLTVFNIGGNKVRLIAAIHYPGSPARQPRWGGRIGTRFMFAQCLLTLNMTSRAGRNK